MLVHCLLVESVYLHRLGGSACRDDVLSDRFDRFQAAPGEKHLGPLASKGECNSAAYGASSSIDHRNLVVQHHLCFPSSPGVVNDADTAPSRKWALTGIARRRTEPGWRAAVLDERASRHAFRLRASKEG